MTPENQARDLSLIRAARCGDGEAKRTLVEKYTPLVRRIARHYYARSMDADDLTQEGLIGLLRAIDEYNPDRFAIKFSSFAYLCIIRKVFNAIKQSNSAKHLVLSNAVSLYGYVSPERTRVVADLLSEAAPTDPIREVEEEYSRRRLEKVLRAHLSILEYRVVGLLVRGYTLAEIEDELGVASKAVDNARTRARLKLKRLLERHGSLLSPAIPEKVRQRPDLYYRFDRSSPRDSAPLFERSTADG